MKLKLAHEGTVIEKVITLSKSINFYNKELEPFFPNCEEWAVKEQKIVHKNELQEINQLAELMKENESFWNLELAYYNLTVTTFLSKYL